MTAETRTCNIRPFQQTGAFNTQKEYSKVNQLLPQRNSAQKVTKLRTKNLEEFNSQQSEQGPNEKIKDKFKKHNKDSQRPLLVPKLLLDKVKS